MKIKRGLLDDFYCFCNDDPRRRTDICSYTRGILKGMSIALLFVVLGVIFGALLLEPLIVGLAWAFTGLWVPSFFGFGDPVVLGIGSALYALIVLTGMLIGIEVLKNIYASRDRPHSDKQHAIFIWYRSVKEKTCFIIDREKQ